MIGSEALSHTVTLKPDGTTTTGPLFNGETGLAVPHVHPGENGGTVNTSFTSNSFGDIDAPTSRSSADPGVINIMGDLEPIE